MSAAATGREVILVTGADLAPQAVALLDRYELVYAGKAPDETLLASLSRAHQPVAIIVRYGCITPSIMDASPRLRVISKHGAGIDTIDSAAAKARGIIVKAAVGANAAAVAEHTWALILACAKKVVHLDRRMREGHWDKATHKSLELRGKTLGLVGLGAIGRRTVKAGLAFDMRIVAHDPFVATPPEGVSLCSLETLYAQADVVSLHCPLTQDNRHMIDRQAIASMRDGAILVNTARGALVDQHAVREAVQSGKLACAGLDSFEVEPFDDAHFFRDVPEIILSPHIGGVTGDAYVSMGTAAATNILDVLAGVAH